MTNLVNALIRLVGTIAIVCCGAAAGIAIGHMAGLQGALVQPTSTEVTAPTAGTLATIDSERRCMAAGLILARIATGGDIEEDWTWRGAPYVVGEWNDALWSEQDDQGITYDQSTEWLAMQVGQCIAADTDRGGNPDDLTATDDAAAEGIDVLMVTWDDASGDLWNALADQRASLYDDQGTNGRGAFMVPMGTTVTVNGETWTADYDGWVTCSQTV